MLRCGGACDIDKLLTDNILAYPLNLSLLKLQNHVSLIWPFGEQIDYSLIYEVKKM